MKKDALTFFKNNMSELYQHYYQDSKNDWMEEAYGDTVFEDFIEVPDFELATLYGQTAGEIDLENCKIVYSNLMMISESQASDERLWAGLCNDIFYDYMRRRYHYNSGELKDSDKDMTGIISRFFYKGSGRSGFFRNTLSKAWWVGRLAYDSQAADKFIRLSYLGSSDFSTKVSDIFYSNSFTSNPIILKGICDAFKHYSERGIKLIVKDHIRPTMQYLNAIGGGTLLDFYSDEEIKKMVIRRIFEIASKKDKGFAYSVDIDDEVDDMGQEEAINTSEMDELIIGDFIEEDEEPKDDFATYESVIRIEVLETEHILEKTIPSKEEFQMGDVIQLCKNMLGKKIGYETFLTGKHYRLVEIIND